MRKDLLIFLLASLCFSACSGLNDDSADGSGSHSAMPEVQDKDGYLVKGLVLADGRPYAGAVVSDGVNVTMTDFEGRYWLRSTEGEDVVWISTPSGYEVDVTDGWNPQFWHRLDRAMLSEGRVQRCDFKLKSTCQDSFRLLVFSDAHIRGVTPPQGISKVDSLVFRNEFFPTLKAAGSQQARTYAVVLGDMISEYAVTQNSTGLPEYKKCLRGLDFPVFHIPGNHDYKGIQYQTYHTEEAREAKQYYIDNLGPTYYSFNIGENHFVMLDGTQMTGGGQNVYKSRITKRQYEWLKKDLTKAKGKSLVICCHQPFYMYATATGQGGGSIQKANRDSIMALTSEYQKVTILSGHQHYSDIYDMKSGSTEIRQYTHTGVCGPTYRSRQCVDGAPCGFTTYDFTGDTYDRNHVSYGDGYDYHASFYHQDVSTAANSDIRCMLVNVPQYEKGWSVVVLEDGVKVREVARVQRMDPGYKKEFKEGNFPDQASVRPIESSHVFEYVPQDWNAMIKISVLKNGALVAEKTINN